jgi:hypothetical protein
MKSIVITVIIIVALVTAGYFAVPLLLESEIAPLRADIQDVKHRLLKAEDFIEKENAARKVSHLSPDADIPGLIRAVNVVTSRVLSLENSMKKDMTVAAKELKEQKMFTSDELRKQTEDIQEMEQEMQLLAQKLLFDASMANVRVHVLKAREDLVYKNIGTAKSEFTLIGETLESLKNSASEENQHIITDFQKMLKSVKDDVDHDLPSAMNKIDLLWHEMGKLLKKS